MSSYPTCGKCLKEEQEFKELLAHSLETPPAKHFLQLRDLFRQSNYSSLQDSYLRSQAAAAIDLLRSDGSDFQRGKILGRLEMMKVYLNLPNEVDKTIESLNAQRREEDRRKDK